MNCLECKGACCEEMLVPGLPAWADPKAAEFFERRGLMEAVSGWIVETRCPYLTEDGRCGCQDTKPEACRDFEEGGKICLNIQRRRRDEPYEEQDSEE